MTVQDELRLYQQSIEELRHKVGVLSFQVYERVDAAHGADPVFVVDLAGGENQ